MSHSRRLAGSALALLALCAPNFARSDTQAEKDRFAMARAEMVETLAGELRRVGLAHGPRLRAILAVFARLPRESFVPQDQRASAYALRSLPIGEGQTISDAFIVAYMTYQLGLKPGDRVLEIGTGSGYQAAVLGSLASRVYTIEIVPQLACRARRALEEQGFDNVAVREGDGYLGWPEAGPFDAIMVTAGAAHIPPALVQQLRPGGRMILPLGPSWTDQRMTLVRKDMRGEVHVSSCGWVFFVPFVGEAQRPAATRKPLSSHSDSCSRPLGPTSRLATPDERKAFHLER